MNPPVRTTTTPPASKRTIKPPTTSAPYKDGNSILPAPGECGVSTQFNVRVVGGSNASLGKLKMN